MKNFLLIILMFLIAFPLAAQDRFGKGYIITDGNETLRGLLRYDTDSELATRVYFKPGPNAVAKRFSPGEVKAFGFDNGRIFERKAMISLRETPAEAFIDTSYVFAKNLVRGKIDLFVRRYPNRNRPHIFLTNNEIEQTVHLKKPGEDELTGLNGRAVPGKNFAYLEKLAWIKNPSANRRNVNRIPFSERKIKKDILQYNQIFEEEYPVHKYSEERRNEFSVLAGIPFQSSGGVHFRTGIYRNRTNVERTSNFSFMQGIVYHHREHDHREVPSTGTISYDYRSQFLNFIPLGVNFHGNSRLIQPYGYIGAGISLAMLRNRSFENFADQGTEISYEVQPTINIGMGAKIKLGSTFLVTEFTPTTNGFFVNLGLSL